MIVRKEEMNKYEQHRKDSVGIRLILYKPDPLSLRLVAGTAMNFTSVKQSVRYMTGNRNISKRC